MEVPDVDCCSWKGLTLRCLLWRGEARVLMAVPDPSCGGIGRGSHGSSETLVVGCV